MIRYFLIIIAFLNVQLAVSQVAENFEDSVKIYNLDNVVVIGEKPHIKGEKGVISVDLPTIIKGKPVSNIYESLAYLPGMTKDASGNLSLIGANTFTILINGKNTNIPIENVIALLQSCPVDRLKNVEIMYSTPARYHVEGASINIVMKKSSVFDGLQGQAGLDFVQQHYSKGSANIAGIYSTDRLTVDLMYNFAFGKNWSHQFIDSHHQYGGEYISVKQNEQSTTKGYDHNGHVGFDWNLGRDNKISCSYNFQFDPIRYAKNLSSGTIGTYITSKDYPSPNRFNNVSVDYESPFGLTTGVSFTDYKEIANTLMREVSQDEILKNYCSSQNVRKYRFYADQSHQINQWGINYGLVVDYSDDYSSQFFVTSGDSKDFSTELKEYSADAYAGMELSLENGLSFSASAKADYYHSDNYTKWWLSPQIAITYVKDQNNIFQIDISTSKDYPSYWEIHGSETWLNNYMVLIGNPLLKPSYSYENQLVYIYRQKYMAVLYYNYTDDPFVQLPYQSPKSLSLIYQTLNYKYSQMLGLMLRVPFNVGQILQSSLTLNGYYVCNKSEHFHDLRYVREKASLYADLTNSFRLSSKCPVTLTFGASALTSSLQGVADLSGIWKIDAGVKWTMLKGNADLTVKGVDLFNTWNPQMTIDKYGQNLKMNTYDMTRQLKASFVYRFNGFKPKTYETDKSRLGVNK